MSEAGERTRTRVVNNNGFSRKNYFFENWWRKSKVVREVPMRKNKIFFVLRNKHNLFSTLLRQL